MLQYIPGKYRLLVTILLVLLVAGTAYKHRNDEWVRRLLRPEPPAKPFQFDNGSVRNLQTGGPGAAAGAATPDTLPPGVMRKCQRGQETIYTDQPCPSGSTAASVGGGNVTVLPGGIVPKESVKPSPGEQGRNTLRDALDISDKENLKGKMMEPVINP